VAGPRNFEASQLRSQLLDGTKIDLFRTMQMPIRRIKRNRHFADEPCLAIDLQRKHRAIDADVFYASRVVIRRSNPGTSDLTDTVTEVDHLLVNGWHYFAGKDVVG